MEELLEKAEESVDDAMEYRHKLSVFASMHPDLDYDKASEQNYLLTENEKQNRAEGNIFLYKKLLKDALTSASRKLETFEEIATDDDYSFENDLVRDRYWERRKDIKEDYDRVVENTARLNHELERELNIDVFEDTEVLEPVGSVSITSSAD